MRAIEGDRMRGYDKLDGSFPGTLRELVQEDISISQIYIDILYIHDYSLCM